MEMSLRDFAACPLEVGWFFDCGLVIGSKLAIPTDQQKWRHGKIHWSTMKPKRDIRSYIEFTDHFRGAPNRFRGSVRSVILSDEWNSLQTKRLSEASNQGLPNFFLFGASLCVILWFKLWFDSQWLAWKHRGSWHQGKGQVPSNPAEKKISCQLGSAIQLWQGKGTEIQGTTFVLFCFYETEGKSPAAKGKPIHWQPWGPNDFLETFFLQGWPWKFLETT